MACLVPGPAGYLAQHPMRTGKGSRKLQPRDGIRVRLVAQAGALPPMMSSRPYMSWAGGFRRLRWFL